MREEVYDGRYNKIMACYAYLCLCVILYCMKCIV